jgi:alanyl-tRNA synthetase
MSSTGVAAEAKDVGAARLYVSKNPPMGEEQIIGQGQKSVSSEPSLIYVAIFSTGKSARIVCFVGQEAMKAGFSAVEIVRQLAPTLGGSGGGSPSFAQGGGPLAGKVDEAASIAQGLLPNSTS